MGIGYESTRLAVPDQYCMWKSGPGLMMDVYADRGNILTLAGDADAEVWR